MMTITKIDAHNKSMYVRAKQQLCLLACLFNSNGRGGGFAPRHLKRSDNGVIKLR
jgi:hypothetical protein